MYFMVNLMLLEQSNASTYLYNIQSTILKEAQIFYNVICQNITLIMLRKNIRSKTKVFQVVKKWWKTKIMNCQSENCSCMKCIKFQVLVWLILILLNFNCIWMVVANYELLKLWLFDFRISFSKFPFTFGDFLWVTNYCKHCFKI